MRTSYDVLIVGAGPAGAHLALRMARSGWSVALLDRRRFPRAKPCGEFLSPECLPMLDDLGLRAPALLRGAHAVAGMELFGYGKRARGRYARVGKAAARFDHGYAIRREVLDELAVRRAEEQDAIELLEGWAFLGLVRDANGAVAGAAVEDPSGERRELSASFTVGADGARSRVAKDLGVTRRLPWLQRYALVARFPVSLGDAAQVHFFPGGYFAAAPLDDETLTLNMVVGRESLSGGGARGLERDLRDHLRRIPRLDALLGEAPIDGRVHACGPFGTFTTRAVADGAALVGDACGFVDPLTGEGLFFAMRGAELLAGALDGALHAKSNAARALRPYARARGREIAPRHALARLLQRGVARPAIAARCLALLAARPGLTDLVVALTGDYVPLRELVRPSVWREALRSAPAATGMLTA